MNSACTASTIAALMLVSVSVGCRHNNKQNDLKEAPDAYGVPSLLGIDPPYSWNSVKDATSAQIALPWSDTYWPLATRGLANRWAANDKITKLPRSPANLTEALESLREAMGSKDILSTVYLSPAEKYDLIAGRIESIDADLWTEIGNLKRDMDPKIRSQLEAIDLQNRNSLDEVAEEQKRLADLSYHISEVATEQRAATSEAEAKRLQNEIDNLIKEHNKLSETIGRAMENYRNNQKSARQIRKPLTVKEALLATKLRGLLAMTSESWGTWAGWELSDVENYLWMGHCHGWALASIVEPAPKHAVLVKKGERKVLFTEGDIRGLTTKLWATQMPPTKFAAMRCNSPQPEISGGRISDGKICLGADCNADGGSEIYVKNNRQSDGFIEYRESSVAKETKFAKFLGGLSDDRVRVAIYANAQDMNKDLQGAQGKVNKQFGALHLTTGCRDVNPMTLHLALTKLIHDRKQGFVIDRERNEEVWNQPVYGYELEYLPILTRSGTQAPGGPTPISDIDDPLAPFRAAGTTHLVQVLARINYGTEISPLLTYAANGSSEATSTLYTVYTLELDQELNIVGGEWGQIPGKKSDPFEPAQAIPDFIWYASPGTAPIAGAFDVDLLKKIHACAAAPVTGTLTLKRVGATSEVREESISYSDCAV